MRRLPDDRISSAARYDLFDTSAIAIPVYYTIFMPSPQLVLRGTMAGSWLDCGKTDRGAAVSWRNHAEPIAYASCTGERRRACTVLISSCDSDPQ